jgi:hypothetical protein
MLSPLVAEAASPSLYALSQRPGSAELLTYELNQALTFPSFTYEPNTVAPLDASLLGPDTITAIGVSGNNLYALSQRPGSAELLTYDLNQALTFPSFTYSYCVISWLVGNKDSGAGVWRCCGRA